MIDPYRIAIQALGCESSETMLEQAGRNSELGLPLVEPQPVHGKALAVVGGGLSAGRQLDILHKWIGEIWAINGACSWLSKQGIASTLVSVDPQECLVDLLEGVETAMLASICHPSAFEALKGKDVRIFHLEQSGKSSFPLPRPINGGSTTATRMHMLALQLGFVNIHYFGCEGSFEGATHTYKSEADPKQVIIRAGGELYRTSLAYLQQTQNLAMFIREFPNIFHDRSGGLLAAMVAHDETWEIVALSEALRDKLDPTSTDLYTAHLAQGEPQSATRSA